MRKDRRMCCWLIQFDPIFMPDYIIRVIWMSWYHRLCASVWRPPPLFISTILFNCNRWKSHLECWVKIGYFVYICRWFHPPSSVMTRNIVVDSLFRFQTPFHISSLKNVFFSSHSVCTKLIHFRFVRPSMLSLLVYFVSANCWVQIMSSLL